MSGPITLATLGWTAARELAFAPHAATGLVPGRVVIEHNHVYRVMTAEGERLAEAAGRLKHLAEGRRMLPVVGDWVALRPDAGGRVLVKAVLPRRSAISRKAAGRDTEEQVVAANIDTLFVVFGLDDHVKTRAIERYLVLARHSGAEPVVLLNKADLNQEASDLEEDLSLARSAAGGVPVVATSTRTGAGFEVLDAHLGFGKTIALVGPSGSGKSSIVNRIIGREHLPTGDVRSWDSRGRHTSVHRQLVIRETGGLIVDTPGMREVQIWETEDVGGAFEEIETLGTSCRFRDCRHETEPGCAVRAAVESGGIDSDRYDSFLTIRREQAALLALRDEKELADEKKRTAKVQNRSLRSLYKDRRRQGR